jgi:hypothetical protein
LEYRQTRLSRLVFISNCENSFENPVNAADPMGLMNPDLQCPPNWENVGGDCLPKTDPGGCPYGEFSDPLGGTCGTTWPADEVEKKMSFEGCTVKCFVKFLIGTDGYDGQIATGIWQAMGEYALREAKKKAIKTVVVKAGSYIVPALGNVSTAISAAEFIRCEVDCCKE